MAYWWPTAFSSWGKEEKAAIKRVLDRDRLTMGPEVEAFEAEFSAYHGRGYGIMTNSGSSANLIAVAALFEKTEKPLTRLGHRNIKSGGAVDNIRWTYPGYAMVPAIAWSTTYAPLVQHGFELKVIDVDDTWNAPVPKVIGGVEVVVVCSILGNPAYLKEWHGCANDAYIIEDNCESLGASQGGVLAGSLGIMSTFSFFYSHQISAVEGGMILTDDANLAKVCRELRSHGWTRDTEHPTDFDTEYNFVRMGYNVRPVEIHAAIAREQLKKLDGFIHNRRANWLAFQQMTADLPIKHPRANGFVSSFGLPFECESHEIRTRLAQDLREAGIDCRLPTGGSFRQHKYGMPWRRFQTPNADRIDRCGMFLGNPPWDAINEIERIVSAVRTSLKRVGKHARASA